MTFKNLAAAACLSLLSSTSSFAATFNVGGEDVDITTISGTFTALQGQLEAQFWWGNSVAASILANTVLDQLVSDFGPADHGPLFVYGVGDFPMSMEGWTYFDDGVTAQVQNVLEMTMFVRTFAVVHAALDAPVSAPKPPLPSPVPLPAGGLLLLSGLAGVAALKRRKERTA
jgi:hypothetical protein